MTSDTHGPTFSILAGVLKRKRYSTAKYRMSPLKQLLIASKGGGRKRPPVTLATKPFDHRGNDQ